MTTLIPTPQDIVYPETDGLPLSDNTKQFRLIMTTQGGLDALFRDQKVFVAGNLLWLPVEGSTESKAPDVMVIFGQDKRDRTAYKQWEENNFGPQVAFEFVSPNNSRQDVEVDKLHFYQRHGIDEYYIHDPDEGTLKGWSREGTWFQPIPNMNDWVSPLLGIRFELKGNDLQLYYPNGEPFETYPELMAQRQRERHEKEQQQQRAERAESRLEQLSASLSNLTPEQLRALGIDPDLLQEDATVARQNLARTSRDANNCLS